MAETRYVGAFGRRLSDTAHLLGLSARLTWRASPRLVLGILLFLLAQAVAPLLTLVLSRLVLDRVALDLGRAAVVDPLAARLPLVTWIAAAAAAVVLGQLLALAAATCQQMAGDRVTTYVTAQIIHAANRWQGLARFEDPDFADDLQRVRTQASRGGLAIMVNGAAAIVHLGTIVGVTLLLARLHPLAPFLLLLASLPALAREWDYIVRVGKHLYDQTPDARRLAYYRDVLLGAEPAQDVRLYGLAPFFGRRYEDLYASTTRAVEGVRGRLMRRVALAQALSAAAMGLTYVYTVWLVTRGRLGVGDVVLYGGAITVLQVELREVAIASGSLPGELHFLPSLFRVLAAPPDLPRPTVPRPAPRPIAHGIVFERVTFAYPGQPTPVLRDVSLRLVPGECVALVGHNGAGKTTLVKLLLRLYDPTAGRILLDGVDLRDYDLDDLRREMGAVFQDFVRYDLTAAENIGLGSLDALDDVDRLLAAAARADADALIAALPRGLETPLGRAFGGRDLSGGEWQKLALARAMVRDAQLLVLDEPTAALDVRTEHDLYARFRDLTRGRITLLISHRFSTVRLADRILYLDDGRIQEDGTHEDLLARGGAYARLYRLQASQYQEMDASTPSREGGV